MIRFLFRFFPGLLNMFTTTMTTTKDGNEDNKGRQWSRQGRQGRLRWGFFSFLSSSSEYKNNYIHLIQTRSSYYNYNKVTVPVTYGCVSSELLSISIDTICVWSNRIRSRWRLCRRDASKQDDDDDDAPLLQKFAEEQSDNVKTRYCCIIQQEKEEELLIMLLIIHQIFPTIK